jgi:hypothetical protein
VLTDPASSPRRTRRRGVSRRFRSRAGQPSARTGDVCGIFYCTRESVSEFVRGLARTRPPVELAVLCRLAEKFAVRLPGGYLELMSQTNGSDGDFGSTSIEFWPVSSIVEVAAREPRYDGVLLFAGEGANTSAPGRTGTGRVERTVGSKDASRRAR